MMTGTFLDSSQLMNLTAVLGFAFFANLPLGYLRTGVNKFSWRWFLYIHLSIPFIIVLRRYLGFGWEIVPFSLAMAVLGQFVGSRFERRKSL